MGSRRTLVLRLVVAGFAAGRAVVEAILAEPYVDLALAEGAILFAFALVFRHFALHAAVFLGGGAHGQNVVHKPTCEKYRK